MRIVANSIQPLSLALVQPTSNLYYNWTTQVWESTFDVANHTKLMAPMAAPLASVQSIDVGDMLVTLPNVAEVFVTVSGTTVTVVDCWSLFLQSMSCGGGFLRA